MCGWCSCWEKQAAVLSSSISSSSLLLYLHQLEQLTLSLLIRASTVLQLWQRAWGGHDTERKDKERRKTHKKKNRAHRKPTWEWIKRREMEGGVKEEVVVVVGGEQVTATQKQSDGKSWTLEPINSLHMFWDKKPVHLTLKWARGRERWL